jgi:hypothetical protein
MPPVAAALGACVRGGSARERGRDTGDGDDVRKAERWREDASLERDLGTTANGIESDSGRGEGAILFMNVRRRLSSSPLSILRAAKSLCFELETPDLEGLCLLPPPASDADESCPLSREEGGGAFPLVWAQRASRESSRTAICRQGRGLGRGRGARGELLRL